MHRPRSQCSRDVCPIPSFTDPRVRTTAAGRRDHAEPCQAIGEARRGYRSRHGARDSWRRSQIDSEAEWTHWFSRPAHLVAPQLIGMALTLGGVGGLIVEVEAYEFGDPASHSFRGPTARNAPMFGAPARAYVYRAYGLHWCFNIVCEKGSAILLRSLEPRTGISTMRARRRNAADRMLCAGPGRLAVALAIDDKMNGASLLLPPFSLERRDRSSPVVSGPRIGISKAADVPWRFGARGSRFLSKPFSAS